MSFHAVTRKSETNVNIESIALYGGSFDPVHKGHENAVNALLSSGLNISETIIMPAFVNPFKAGIDRSRRASDIQRLEMCRIAFEHFPHCTVSDFEISRGDISYTVLTLEMLREKYPHKRLILTVGSDSLESLPKWFKFKDIINYADIAAISRSDRDSGRLDMLAEIIRREGGTVHIIKAKPFEISSTEIREKIMNNCDISCYISENVVKYINSEKIYR